MGDTKPKRFEKTEPKPKRPLTGAAAMGAGPGRPKGSKNKLTPAKKAFQDLLEQNLERVQGWIDGIEEEKGPEQAFYALMTLAEFSQPKMARVDATISGPDGGPVETITHIHFPESK